MIRYGDEFAKELTFVGIDARIERRDGQWVDVVLRFATAEETPIPSDLIDLTGLIVCTHEGHPIQMIPLDEGCDCEYQFTVGEKEQIEAYIRSEAVQTALKREAMAAG
ncbi:hypothetical protein [Cohnella nanjingensis]|uniref:Uncharacterized protein n=1 Tax=Cohnella nanjingensis TaxID=1387779 RepID=A0A7X0VCS6_9BACL|nr:hypothetical protein [Cohnella nanjingensis]MBB6669205.1 hypothetical protein [Cohnella nanjingensis]